MNQPLKSPDRLPDWDALYREGTPPWDIGSPKRELVEVLEKGGVPVGTVLELGCGTGADAIHLARRGFEVTAVDSSPMALERAHTRAEMTGALVRFVLADVYSFGPQAGPFEFVYDGGFYHFARQADLRRYLDLLWRVTKPGSYYLCLAGSTGEEAEGGPPQVSEEQIRGELGRLFEFIHLRPCRIESPRTPQGYLGWSCLMRRPQLAKSGHP
jgi:SAM-dependent methyltransferase